MARRLLLVILGPPVLLLALALLAMWLPLPEPFPAAFGSARTRFAAIVTGILGVVYLIGLTLLVVSWLVGASRSLDDALLPMGLAPKIHLLLGRKYQGVIQGRPLRVAFTPSVALQLALLNVHVATKSDRRMAIGRTRPLMDCRKCPRVPTTPIELAGLHVYAEDIDWASEFLADARNRQLVADLISLRGISGKAELYFQPGEVWLRARLGAGGAQACIEQWIVELVALAKGAEESG